MLTLPNYPARPAPPSHSQSAVLYYSLQKGSMPLERALSTHLEFTDFDLQRCTSYDPNWTFGEHGTDGCGGGGMRGVIFGVTDLAPTIPPFSRVPSS